MLAIIRGCVGISNVPLAFAFRKFGFLVDAADAAVGLLVAFQQFDCMHN